jgi:hypothetical protein
MNLRHLGAVGKRFAVAGNAGLVASIIAGFPRIEEISPPFSLIEIVSQLSYPLNSENASPFGTLTLYLSWAEIAAPAARTASATVMLTPINRFLPFICRSSLIRLMKRHG